MKIRAGYEIVYDCPQPTPMILMLNVHPEREADLVTPDALKLDPPVHARIYKDIYGNTCTRIVAPAGRLSMSADFVISDPGTYDDHAPAAPQHPVEDLPDDVLLYLLGSRYCETQRLLEMAWKEFGHLPKGWPLVQGIVDYVHNHVTFGYQHASPHKTSYDAFTERQGVCRDFTHLAVTLCRCMNVPARYCTGYLGDIGVPKDPAPMDFSAWFEVYLGGRWYTFDARHNHPRMGRVVMARGRDAADVAMVTNFGAGTLAGFTVVTDEIVEAAA